jgi:alcohol dehydrogenase YqhD (iron-dependent ADH family)
MVLSSITRALPVGSVLTLAATGSEMNAGSVITNEETREKLGKGSSWFVPKFSILDPTFTYSVPPRQTAAGVDDIMAHTYEYYFSPITTAFLQDSFCEAVLRTCIKYGPIAITEPDNYEARANLMWASSMALNGVVSKGKTFEGTLHGVEHAISAITDITHGVGLAILTVHWFDYILDDTTRFKFVELAKNVWGVAGMDDEETARLGITKTREFLRSLGLPLSFSEVGIGSEHFEAILDRAMVKQLGVLRNLDRDEVREILMRAR